MLKSQHKTFPSTKGAYEPTRIICQVPPKSMPRSPYARANQSVKSAKPSIHLQRTASRIVLWVLAHIICFTRHEYKQSIEHTHSHTTKHSPCSHHTTYYSTLYISVYGSRTKPPARTKVKRGGANSHSVSVLISLVRLNVRQRRECARAPDTQIDGV